MKNTAIAQTNTNTAQPRLKYAVLRLVFHWMQVWQSRLTPISGTHRLIACVHISNICRIANTITARATIMDTTVTILCIKGASFHYVFISHSAFLLPSLSKALFRAFSVKKIGTIKVTVFTKLTISPTAATTFSELPITNSIGITVIGMSKRPKRNHSLPIYLWANSQPPLLFHRHNCANCFLVHINTPFNQEQQTFSCPSYSWGIL